MKVGDKWTPNGENTPKYTIIERDGKLHWSWVKQGVADSILISHYELQGSVAWGRRYIEFKEYYEKVQA